MNWMDWAILTIFALWLIGVFDDGPDDTDPRPDTTEER